MVHAARLLLAEIEDTVRQALEDRPSFDLLLVGHSLGAGIAVMSGMVLKKAYPRLQCWTFAPPACVDLHLAGRCRSFTISIMGQYDVIPRFSVAAVEFLRERLCNFDWDKVIRMAETNAEWRMIAAAVGAMNRLRTLQMHAVRKMEQLDKTLRPATTATRSLRAPSRLPRRGGRTAASSSANEEEAPVVSLAHVEGAECKPFEIFQPVGNFSADVDQGIGALERSEAFIPMAGEIEEGFRVQAARTDGNGEAGGGLDRTESGGEVGSSVKGTESDSSMNLQAPSVMHSAVMSASGEVVAPGLGRMNGRCGPDDAVLRADSSLVREADALALLPAATKPMSPSMATGVWLAGGVLPPATAQAVSILEREGEQKRGGDLPVYGPADGVRPDPSTSRSDHQEVDVSAESASEGGHPSKLPSDALLTLVAIEGANNSAEERISTEHTKDGKPGESSEHLRSTESGHRRKQQSQKVQEESPGMEALEAGEDLMSLERKKGMSELMQEDVQGVKQAAKERLEEAVKRDPEEAARGARAALLSLYPPGRLLVLTSDCANLKAPEMRLWAPYTRSYGVFLTNSEARAMHWGLREAEATDFREIVVSMRCVADHMLSTLAEGLTALQNKAPPIRSSVRSEE